jgi:hypothetical protein
MVVESLRGHRAGEVALRGEARLLAIGEPAHKEDDRVAVDERLALGPSRA